MKRVIAAGSRRLEYTLIQSVRSNVLFQALPESSIRVYAPRGMRLRDIDAMVRQRAAQLEAMLESVERRQAEDRWAHRLVEGSIVTVEGVPHALRLTRSPKLSCEASNGELRLTLPRPDSDPEVRALIRSAMSARALERIRQRIGHFAPMLGVQPNRVAVRDQKTRWGSCSSKHNLNFNWKLILAPPQALDYVVVHELCHLHEFNHSPRFWALVEAQMPDYEVWKKWLKTHTDDMYL